MLLDPELACAIMLAVKSILVDSKSLSTAQNRIAKSLTGIKPSDIASRGVPTMRLLLATAPGADSASEFIPQQRAIFVLRHVSSWLASDEVDDLPEELEFRLAELYNVLAPIVQDLPGGHWDSIFDLMESGIEVSIMTVVLDIDADDNRHHRWRIRPLGVCCIRAWC